MPVDPKILLNWPFPDQRHDIIPRDVMLYALAVGLGKPSTDTRQLPFVYEEGLQVLPMMANVLGYRGFWMKEPGTGIDWRRVLHVQHRIALHGPLPASGTIESRQRVTAVVDRGRDRGAFVVTRREILESGTGALLAEVEQTNMLRGDGGFGQGFGNLVDLDPVPDRVPDRVRDLPVIEQAALFYRLCGDYNPLHADPEVARAAGFDRPILHGLCTFAMVGHAVLSDCIDYQADRFRSLEGRFSAPLFPGETLRVETWDGPGGDVLIRGRALERNVVVFDRGRARITSSRSAPTQQDEKQGVAA